MTRANEQGREPADNVQHYVGRIRHEHAAKRVGVDNRVQAAYAAQHADDGGDQAADDVSRETPPAGEQ